VLCIVLLTLAVVPDRYVVAKVILSLLSVVALAGDWSLSARQQRAYALQEARWVELLAAWDRWVNLQKEPNYAAIAKLEQILMRLGS
jgi:hypothetical protein